MILSAKIIGNSFEVVYDDGDILSVPNLGGNRHYKELYEWVVGGGVVEDEYTTAELAAQALQVIEDGIREEYRVYKQTLDDAEYESWKLTR